MSVTESEKAAARTPLPSATGEVRAELRRRSREIMARYPAGRERSALLPMLHLVQSVDGYVSPEGIGFCAEELGLTKAEVGAVATFYTMFKRRPAGEYLVSVCTNTMCGVLGGQRAYEALSEHLGVGHDQTTEDGQITLEHAECLAACDYGPVLTVNYEFFDQIDAELALDIVRRLLAGERPHPTRGARLCSFKEISLQLAGFGDERDGAIGDGPAGEPTLAGNLIAEERGISVPGFDPATPITSPSKETPAKTPPPKTAPAKTAPTAEAPSAEAPPAEAAKAGPGAEVPDAAPGTPPAAPEPAVDRKPAGDTPAGSKDVRETAQEEKP